MSCDGSDLEARPILEEIIDDSAADIASWLCPVSCPAADDVQVSVAYS